MALSPARNGSWFEFQLVEQTERSSRQTVATALVAWKRRLVDDSHACSMTVEMNCGSDSRRTRADDEDIVSIAQWGDALHEPQTRVAPHDSPM